MTSMVRPRIITGNGYADERWKIFTPGRCVAEWPRNRWRSEGAGKRLDRHPQAAEHLQIGLGGPPERGEVVADDDRVDAAQHPGLGAEVAEGQLASSRVAQDGARQRQPERCNR